MSRPDAIGARALEMREDGATYQKIADELGISKGKAHHQVRLARSAASGGAEEEAPGMSSSERDLRIVLMRQRRVPVREVAATFGVSDRHVRRAMGRWREGADRGESAAVKSVDTRMRQLAHELDDVEREASSKAQGPEERISALSKAAHLVTQMTLVAGDGGLLARQHLLLDFMGGRKQARKEERVEVVRAINRSVRDLFSHCEAPDVEAVIDAVMAGAGYE